MTVINGVIVGSWYQTADGRTFKIVAFDRDDETLEIQYTDGGLDELDLEFWSEIEPMPIGSPDYRSSPYFMPDDTDDESRPHSLSDLLGELDHNDVSH